MPADIPLRCTCGAVTGALRAVSPKTGIRYVCHCDDCQVFAEFLGASERVLDPNGGTDVYQTACSRLEINSGRERLACMKATSKSLLRWYASCCNSPLLNSYDRSQRSFMSVLVSCTAPSRRDTVFGESAGHAWVKFGWGDLSKLRRLNIPAMLWRIVTRIVYARLSGDYRNTPLFDRRIGRPIAEPYHLPANERRALEDRLAGNDQSKRHRLLSASLRNL